MLQAGHRRRKSPESGDTARSGVVDREGLAIEDSLCSYGGGGVGERPFRVVPPNWRNEHVLDIGVKGLRRGV